MRNEHKEMFSYFHGFSNVLRCKYQLVKEVCMQISLWSSYDWSQQTPTGGSGNTQYLITEGSNRSCLITFISILNYLFIIFSLSLAACNLSTNLWKESLFGLIFDAEMRTIINGQGIFVYKHGFFQLEKGWLNVNCMTLWYCLHITYIPRYTYINSFVFFCFQPSNMKSDVTPREQP